MDNMSVMQEINNNEGQIAGRDIHNHFQRDYWGWDSEALISEWESCRHKLRAAQRKILLAPNMVMFFAVAFFLIMAVVTGKLVAAPKEQFLGYALLALFALVVFPKANKKYGKFITLQKNRIEHIELVLMDRGIEL